MFFLFLGLGKKKSKSNEIGKMQKAIPSHKILSSPSLYSFQFTWRGTCLKVGTLHVHELGVRELGILKIDVTASCGAVTTSCNSFNSLSCGTLKSTSGPLAKKSAQVVKISTIIMPAPALLGRFCLTDTRCKRLYMLQQLIQCSRSKPVVTFLWPTPFSCWTVWSQADSLLSV